MTKPVCIIAARAGSKRLPGKNKIDFNGQPIITYPIRAAKAAGIFSHIIVSTDDDEIRAIADAEGVWGWHRPDGLAGDQVEETDVYRDILERLQPDQIGPDFCAIYPTAAFITAQDIVSARGTMIHAGADVCMGVTGFDIHPYRTLIPDSEGFLYRRWEDLNESPSRLWPAAFASNGTLYWFKTEPFRKNATYFPAKLVGYETFAIDIDTPADLARAREQISGPSRSCLPGNDFIGKMNEEDDKLHGRG